MFRFIFYTILAFFVLKIFRFIQVIGKKSISSKGRPVKNLSGVMVKDNICQTYLPKEDAIRELNGGQEYFFCSKECQNKFLKKNK
ncbi:YHS domain-containing protein [Acidobacteriota bacterium]